MSGAQLPWIIQTGPGNHDETMRYFERRSFFGLLIRAVPGSGSRQQARRMNLAARFGFTLLERASLTVEHRPVQAAEIVFQRFLGSRASLSRNGQNTVHAALFQSGAE
jgi:hypothetical protein